LSFGKGLFPETRVGTSVCDGPPWHARPAATADHLRAEGFRRFVVTARQTGIGFEPDGTTAGPFCRLDIAGAPPELPGVYAWVVDGEVRYVGLSNCLRQVVHGAKMHRAPNDYTSVARSQASDRHSPRTRVNALENEAVVAALAVEWHGRVAASTESPAVIEADYIARWRPPSDRAVPTAR
jgi:hypothetical protein